MGTPKWKHHAHLHTDWITKQLNAHVYMNTRTLKQICASYTQINTWTRTFNTCRTPFNGCENIRALVCTWTRAFPPTDSHSTDAQAHAHAHKPSNYTHISTHMYTMMIRLIHTNGHTINEHSHLNNHTHINTRPRTFTPTESPSSNATICPYAQKCTCTQWRCDHTHMRTHNQWTHTLEQSYAHNTTHMSTHLYTDWIAQQRSNLNLDGVNGQ